ncbi:MAG: hypothetical protein ACT4QD_12910 [Acidobacteriota bacterium]
MIGILLLAGQMTGSTLVPDCSGVRAAAMTTARDFVLRGDDGTALDLLRREAHAAAGGCAELQIAARALEGWMAARALAPLGGAPATTGPVLEMVARLGSWRVAGERIDAEYAQTAIRAAIAAAQDERDEMALLLAHARDLAERIAARDRRAEWPRSFNLLAGELWLEVDRYEEARLAFDRAVRGEATPLALVGLARAAARLGRRAAACGAYARIGDAATALASEAREFLTRCP